MTTLLPALRSGSLLRPFLGDFFADLDEFNWPTASWAEGSVGFRMDVAEYKDRYVLTAELAGIRNEEVEITLNNGRLCIEVKPHAEVQDSSDTEVRYIVRERRLGAMTRTILLPYVTPEKNIDASMKDGVLTVTIKKDEALMPKKIAVH
jgi:HSP20 family protein